MEKIWSESELRSLPAERVKEIARSYDIKPSFKLKNIELILATQSGKKVREKRKENPKTKKRLKNKCISTSP